jgi:hypothetical protein
VFKDFDRFGDRIRVRETSKARLNNYVQYAAVRASGISSEGLTKSELLRAQQRIGQFIPPSESSLGSFSLENFRRGHCAHKTLDIARSAISHGWSTKYSEPMKQFNESMGSTRGQPAVICTSVRIASALDHHEDRSAGYQYMKQRSAIISARLQMSSHRRS